ncbi:FAM50-like protein [Temnothorax longispinosus]|uniref:FAM50-like protein n=1 Tax=Temnothorax longispinosus TaxID=300112 RepID=A0A4S2JRC7_9HYME|nr:FAM50-like protein [Temnothorax longispinosus]
MTLTYVVKVTLLSDLQKVLAGDREREEEENKLKEELRQEWARKQNALKEEEIEITFSYWNGFGHHRSVIMKKGRPRLEWQQAIHKSMSEKNLKPEDCEDRRKWRLDNVGQRRRTF